MKELFLVGRKRTDKEDFCLYFTKYTTHEKIDSIVWNLNKMHPNKDIKAYRLCPAGSYDPDPC